MTDKATANELTGKEKSLANLKPVTSRTPEEQREISRLGGIARGEQRRQQRTMREQAQIYLQSLMSQEQAKTYLGVDAEKLSVEDLTVQGIMIAKMAQEAMQNGNAKAAEFVRDTSGQRPKDVVEVNAEIITASDRSLIDKVAERLGNLTDENE